MRQPALFKRPGERIEPGILLFVIEAVKQQCLRCGIGELHPVDCFCHDFSVKVVALGANKQYELLVARPVHLNYNIVHGERAIAALLQVFLLYDAARAPVPFAAIILLNIQKIIMRQEPCLEGRRECIKLAAVIDLELLQRRVSKVNAVHNIDGYGVAGSQPVYVEHICFAIHAAHVKQERTAARL